MNRHGIRTTRTNTYHGDSESFDAEGLKIESKLEPIISLRGIHRCHVIQEDIEKVYQEYVKMSKNGGIKERAHTAMLKYHGICEKYMPGMFVNRPFRWYTVDSKFDPVAFKMTYR